MSRLALAFLLSAAALAAGCHQSAHSGVVVQDDQVHGRPGQAPAVALRTADGRASTLAGEVQPIYVVAFVGDEDGACCQTPYRLCQVAERLRRLNVSVVQIRVPPAGAPAGQTTCTDCPPPCGNFFRFDDPARAAWAAFGRPAAGTLLLVDPDRRIDRRTDLCTPDHLVFRAARLANDYRCRDWRDRLEAPHLE